MAQRIHPDNLRQRTKRFALAIISLYKSLPKNEEARILGRQILRSGTSVGAQYREATRSRSRAEFISKIESGMQELDETIYWLELLVEANISSGNLEKITNEANELAAILVTSVKTAKRNK